MRVRACAGTFLLCDARSFVRIVCRLRILAKTQICQILSMHDGGKAFVCDPNYGCRKHCLDIVHLPRCDSRRESIVSSLQKRRLPFPSQPGSSAAFFFARIASHHPAYQPQTCAQAKRFGNGSDKCVWHKQRPSSCAANQNELGFRRR